jgi:hypothetical protein
MIFARLKQWYRDSNFYVRHRSQYHNLYHCTIQKAASQWVRAILADERIYRYSGLDVYKPEAQLPGGNDPRKITERAFDLFPPYTIVTPLYIDYSGFARMPKLLPYRAFFVMRDPRDVLVSWYFSIKNSHPSTAEIDRIRGQLGAVSESDGLLYSLDYLNAYGLFEAQRSWGAAKDANILLVRYEDLVGPEQERIYDRLLTHGDIHIPSDVLKEVLQAHSFEKLSGRARGDEDAGSHYRKGIAGDWRHHFSDRVEARFRDVAGDLLGLWNYS